MMWCIWLERSEYFHYCVRYQRLCMRWSTSENVAVSVYISHSAFLQSLFLLVLELHRLQLWSILRKENWINHLKETTLQRIMAKSLFILALLAVLLLAHAVAVEDAVEHATELKADIVDTAERHHKAKKCPCKCYWGKKIKKIKKCYKGWFKFNCKVYWCYYKGYKGKKCCW